MTRRTRPPDGYHSVAPGDWLSKIAWAYGFADWTVLWDHPNNAAIKNRGDPNLLKPGEKVFIPEPATAGRACRSDARTRFVLARPTAAFRIVLQDAVGRPREDLRYAVEIDGRVVKNGETGADGAVAFVVPEGAQRGTLVAGRDWESPEVYPLNFGMAPLDEVLGCQQRLANLGYYRGAADGVAGPLTRTAVQSFRAAEGLPPGDGIDEPFRDRLRARAGC